MESFFLMAFSTFVDWSRSLWARAGERSVFITLLLAGRVAYFEFYFAILGDNLLSACFSSVILTRSILMLTGSSGLYISSYFDLTDLSFSALSDCFLFFQMGKMSCSSAFSSSLSSSIEIKRPIEPLLVAFWSNFSTSFLLGDGCMMPFFLHLWQVT